MPGASCDLTRGVHGPPHSPPTWSCSGWGLPSEPVARLLVVSYTTIAPLPSGHTLPQAVSFCGTVPGVAPAGRYPAPCPVEFGLSSNTTSRSLCPRLPNLLYEQLNIPSPPRQLPCTAAPLLRTALLLYYFRHGSAMCRKLAQTQPITAPEKARTDESANQSTHLVHLPLPNLSTTTPVTQVYTTIFWRHQPPYLAGTLRPQERRTSMPESGSYWEGEFASFRRTPLVEGLHRPRRPA